MNEHFENARGFYAAVMQDLEEIAVSLKNFFRTQGQEFNTDLFYRQYDCLLQYSLLHTAIIDNDFDLNEVVFIRDLTEHADLMDYLNSICDTDFSWQLIFKGEIAAISTSRFSPCTTRLPRKIICKTSLRTLRSFWRLWHVRTARYPKRKRILPEIISWTFFPIYRIT